LGLFSRAPEKPKTSLDLIEDQLEFWRRKINDMYTRQVAYERIKTLEDHLMAINKEQMPERMKALEDALAEILLLGKEDKNE
jgi:hypothetical protein